MQHEHTSPFEHNQLSFRIKAPLFVARQWFRHRMNSYNEISYRYVKADMKEYYMPNTWRLQDKVNKQSSIGSFEREDLKAKYKAAVDATMKVYDELLAEGVCREQARALLPMSTYTEFIFTCNLHSLMHFIKLRLSPDAQYEIRVYAKALLSLAYEYFPISLKAFCTKAGISGDGIFDFNKN
jgi:thymidylate synthase (FAD)